VSGDIVERLRDCGVFTTTDENGDVQAGMRLVSPKDCNEAADEIERLRAEVLRKHDYGCRMDALAEERLMEITRLWLAGAALAEVALYARSWITPVAAMNFRDRLDAALAAWQEARREQ
jgi:hypothetical protein